MICLVTRGAAGLCVNAAFSRNEQELRIIATGIRSKRATARPPAPPAGLGVWLVEDCDVAGTVPFDLAWRGRVVRFWMAAPTRLLNETSRMHWQQVRHHNNAMGGTIRLAIRTAVPLVPYVRALLRVERCSLRAPDYDGMVGGLKGLIDCLLPPGATYQAGNGPHRKLLVNAKKVPRPVVRHPNGCSVVADDNPACLRSDYRSVVVRRRADQGTLVTVLDLSDTPRHGAS